MKIKEEELKVIKGQQTRLNKLINDIGVLESQKHSLLHEIANVNKEIETSKQEIEQAYGSITIDLSDGSYKKNPKETDETNV